jgi:hypothetical protein
MKLDIKSFLIGALVVALALLGYLDWGRQRNTVEIKLPSFCRYGMRAKSPASS